MMMIPFFTSAAKENKYEVESQLRHSKKNSEAKSEEEEEQEEQEAEAQVCGD